MYDSPFCPYSVLKAMLVRSANPSKAPSSPSSQSLGHERDGVISVQEWGLFVYYPSVSRQLKRRSLSKRLGQQVGSRWTEDLRMRWSAGLEGLQLLSCITIRPRKNKSEKVQVSPSWNWRGFPGTLRRDFYPVKPCDSAENDRRRAALAMLASYLIISSKASLNCWLLLYPWNCKRNNTFPSLNLSVFSYARRLPKHINFEPPAF